MLSALQASLTLGLAHGLIAKSYLYGNERISNL